MNKRRVWALVLSIVMVLSVFAYAPVQNVEAAGVSVQYKSHVQTFGWESAWKRDGEASGTSGKAKRLEGIRITVSGDNLGSVIQHIARHMAGSRGFRMVR